MSAANPPPFDDLLGPLVGRGYALAVTMLNDRAAAEDAVQEAAIKAWRKLPRLRDRSAVEPWFLAIVANQCKSVRRGRWWSVVRLPLVELAAPEFDSERTDIDRALAKLPAEDRLALFLHFYLDLPLDEVGTVLRLSAAGAKTRVYRAARKLRPDLEMS